MSQNDDLISRQAAIDALTEYGSGNDIYMSVRELKRRIEALPSAHPEIIRCNACKHWTQTTGDMPGFGLGDCDYHNAKLVNCNGYCYWAERKTNVYNIK